MAGRWSTYIIFPEYFLTSGFDTPLVNVWPRKYVLLFIEVDRPLNDVWIARVFDPSSGTILKLPPSEISAVNRSRWDGSIRWNN